MKTLKVLVTVTILAVSSLSIAGKIGFAEASSFSATALVGTSPMNFSAAAVPSVGSLSIDGKPMAFALASK